MAVVDGHAADEKENLLVEPEPCNQNQQSTKGRKRLREYEEVYATKERKRQRGLFLANRKPSYCLRLGIGTCGPVTGAWGRNIGTGCGRSFMSYSSAKTG